MKKSMKIILTLVLSIFVLFTTACSNSAEDGKLHIGIVQLVENGAFEDMREGFIEKLRDLGYTEDQLEIHYKNAQGDMANLNTITQEMVNSGMDLVATIATPASQAMVNIGSDIPVVFIAVSNPVGAGIISDMDSPDKNATGTSNAIPVEEIFNLAEKLTPGNKTYGLLYNTSEVNSVTTINEAKEYLDANGYDYVEAVVTNSSEVQQATQSLIGNVDGIFVPNDSLIQSAMPQVAEIAKNAQIPVFGSSTVMVESGAFATISISDKEIGGISASMADEILKGKDISEIPSVTISTFETVINKETAENIGVNLTDEILKDAVLVE